jgi:hypothetical protein
MAPQVRRRTNLAQSGFRHLQCPNHFVSRDWRNAGSRIRQKVGIHREA